MSDPRVEVRGWAAAHLLPISPDAAVAIPEAIASGPPSLEEFSAKMVLKQWREETVADRDRYRKPFTLRYSGRISTAYASDAATTATKSRPVTLISRSGRWWRTHEYQAPTRPITIHSTG